MAIMGNLVTRFFMSLDPTSPTLIRKRKNPDSPDFQPCIKKVKRFDLIDEEVPDSIKERFFKGSCTFCGVVKKKGLIQGVCFACRKKGFRKHKRVFKNRIVKVVEKEEQSIDEDKENIVETQNDTSDGDVIVEEGRCDVHIQVENSDVLTDDKENVENYCVEEENKENENMSETKEDMELEIVDALANEYETEESSATDLITEESKLELEEHEITTEVEEHEILEKSSEAVQESEDVDNSKSGMEITEDVEKSEEIESFEKTNSDIIIENSEKNIKETEETSAEPSDKITDVTQKQFLHNFLLSAIEKVNILKKVKIFRNKINIFENKSGETLDITEAVEETQTNNTTEKDFLHNFPSSAMEEINKLQEPENFSNTLNSYEEKFDKIEQAVKDSETVSIEENMENTNEPIIEEPNSTYSSSDEEPLIEEPESSSSDNEGSSSSSHAIEITEEMDEVENHIDTETNDEHKGSVDIKFDTLVLRNRTITETLSPIYEDNNEEISSADNGNDSNAKFDTLVLRNRNVTETLSPIYEDNKEEGSSEDDEITLKVPEKSEEDISAILDNMKKNFPKRISRKSTTGSSSSRQPQRESRASARSKTNKSN